MSLTAGTRLGPYEITSALGAGGMGEVYRARDPRLGRDVAIKVMSGVMTRDRNPVTLRSECWEWHTDVPGGSATPGACCTSSMSGEAAARYIVPVAHLSVQLGLRDIAGIRESLAKCAGGGAAPFSVVATNRALLEAYRRDPAIDRLLDDLHDGARSH